MSRDIHTNITLNTRDLGGLKTSDGFITKKNVFIRSDNLAYNDDSIYSLYDLVKKHHLRTVIDLRTKKEIEDGISAASLFKDIDYHNVSLVNYMVLGYGIPTGHEYAYLSDWYLEILEKSKKEIKEILEIIANSKKGAVLYNCTMGKDRTGIISCLLLMIAHVSVKTISTDHFLSNSNVAHVYAPYLHQLKEDQIMFTNVQYDDMKRVIRYIISTYGCIENYLNSCEISNSTISKIRKRFIEKRKVKK